MEIKLSQIKELLTFRFDSDYYQKEYILIDNMIKNNKDKFKSFIELGLNIDASAFYPSLEPFYNQGNIPFIRVADVGSIIDYDNCVRIPKMNNNFNTLKLCKKGDIVLTKGGTIAKAGLIQCDSYVTRDLIYINSSKLNEMDYISLFLLFCSNFMYKQMIKSSSFSVQPHLTITLIKELLIFQFSELFKKTLFKVYFNTYNLINNSKIVYSSAENLLLSTLGLNNFKPNNNKGISIKSFKDSFGVSGRLDSEYYQPKYEEIEDILKSKGYTLFEDICELINYGSVPTSPYVDDNKGIPYIKGMNLKDTYIIGEFDKIINTEDLPNKVFTKKGDIIISQMGTVGDVGIIEEYQENWIFASFTIRARLKQSSNYNPYYIGLYIQKIAKEYYLHKNIAHASVRQNTDLPTIKKMYIPNIPQYIQQQIADKIQESFSLRKKSTELLELAKKAVEVAIEDGEDKALELISSYSEEFEN